MDIATVEDVTLADDLGDVLARLYAFLRRRVLPRGMSISQVLTLSDLRDLGPQRVTDLAGIEGLRQPTCTGLINTMEAEGWVSRRVDDSDRRAVIVEITENGRDVLASITDARAQVLQGYLSGLGVSEKKALRGAFPVLKKLVES
jgi:DNA-binding MarR family transcriptional regulator